MVSVVVIFFNAERFIREAIESVISQTYGNWELLLVDDGSTDDSTHIGLDYVHRDPRIKYFEHDHHSNRGMSASRNLGVAKSTGRYVAFLDSDDVWLPQKLHRQLAMSAEYPAAAMICGPSQWWFSWTGDPVDAHRDAFREIGVPPDTLFDPPSLFDRFLRREARTPATCSVLIRRDVFDIVDGFDEEFRGMYEDQVFFAKVYRCVAVFVSSECLDRYRQHSTSHCAVEDSANPSHYLDVNPSRQVFLQWLRRYAGSRP